MNERKIIKFGKSSYVITLPMTWVTKNSLKKGDKLTLLENENSLIFSTKNNLSPTSKEVTLKIDKLPPKLFNKILISYYLKNYKFIRIECSNLIEKLEEIRIFKEKLPSIEIFEIGKDYLVLKDLSNLSNLNTKVLIKKIIGIIELLFEELIIERRNSFIMQLDSNINKLYFLTLKTLNYNLLKQEMYEENINVVFYWRIVSELEMIGDILKRVGRYIKNGTEKNILDVTKMIISLREYFLFITKLLNLTKNLDNNLQLYLDKKHSILKEIDKFRENFRDSINYYLLVTQFIKDVIGRLDNIILSIIDIHCN